MNQTIAKGKIARLKRQLKSAGISQQRVATRAGVTLPHVCNVFAERHVSRRVLDAARTLLAEKKAATNGDQATTPQALPVPA